MEKERLQKFLALAITIAATVFLGMCFFVSIHCSGDGGGAYLQWIYALHDLGSVEFSIKEIMNPEFLIMQVIHGLHIGLNGVEQIVLFWTVWYSLTIFFALRLIMYGRDKNRWTLALATFMFIPYAKSNENHMLAATITLFLLYSFSRFLLEKKYILLFISIVMSIYALLFTADRILLILYIAVPVLVYGFIYCIQHQERRKILYMSGLGISFALAIVKLIDMIGRYVYGNGLAFLDAWSGYGGDSYLTWIDVYNFFDKGIVGFFGALLTQYNIPISGGMIQLESFYWLIRIGVVLLMLFAWGGRWKDIVKYGVENIPIIDSLATIGATTLIGINVLNGMNVYYELEEMPMNRYANLAWFLLVIIMVRWVAEKYKGDIIMHIRGKKISSEIILGMIGIILIIGYATPAYFGRATLITETGQKELELLKSYGGQYRYGFASFERSAPITALTNGEYIAYAARIKPKEDGLDELQWRVSEGDGIYLDGSRCFNYILSYENNDATLSAENINALRGDYIDKKGVYGEDETSIIYLYDYDIRWDSRIIMESVGTDYELTEPIEYHFDFQVGINRIEMKVGNSQNFNLNIVDNPDISNVDIKVLDENKIYVDLICNQNTKATLQVARMAEEFTTIHRICLKRVLAAVPVEIGKSVYLNSGEYVFTFAGENLKNLQLDWLGEGIEVTQLTDGKIRQRYHVKVSVPQEVKYVTEGTKYRIDEVFYENAVLF